MLFYLRYVTLAGKRGDDGLAVNDDKLLRSLAYVNYRRDAISTSSNQRIMAGASKQRDVNVR